MTDPQPLLVPSLMRAVEKRRLELMRSIDLKDTNGYTDLGDERASILVGTTRYWITTDRSTVVFKALLGPHCKVARFLLLTWSVRVDTDAGQVWAVPRFDGLKVYADENFSQELDLQTVMAHCARAHVLRTGSAPMVQLGDVTDTEFSNALEVLGLPQSILSRWLWKEDRDQFRRDLTHLLLGDEDPRVALAAARTRIETLERQLGSARREIDRLRHPIRRDGW